MAEGSSNHGPSGLRSDHDLSRHPGQRVLAISLLALAASGLFGGVQRACAQQDAAGALPPASLPPSSLPPSSLPANSLPQSDAGYPGQGTGAQPTAPQVGADGLAVQPAGSTLPSGTAGDPPARVVRISVLQGNVSAEPSGVNTFSPAEINGVLTTGDRVYTDVDAEAELQAGGLAVRLGGGTDLTVSAMTDTLGQFGVAAGSVHLRSFALDPGTVLEVDSPEAAVTVLQPGDVRVDVDAAAHTTTVTLVSGQVQVDGPGTSQMLTPGETFRLHGLNPDTGQAAFAEPLPPPASDALDGFSDGRDNLYASGTDAASPYLNSDTTGGADLAGYGAWDTSDFGPVWFPVVAVDWQPYRFGHWRWVPPWGWTWVGVEPWGFAPFHYGRWAFLIGRWGWIPGSPAVRPIYAPALVAFAGGAQFSASLGYAPGLGIAAWFPLGAREPYTPWYHGSTLYLNRVNASNIFNANAAEVRGFYNQRAINVFIGAAFASRGYANRLQGTVAVPQTSFAAGLAVNHAVLHLDPETLAAAPLLPHPLVAPERSMLVPGTARATPPTLPRPVLAGQARGDDSVAGLTGAVLFHRAEPPLPRPSFEQQREAMDRSEPGRPLSPTQMESMRPNRIPNPSAVHDSGARPASSRPAAPAPKASPAPASAGNHTH